MSDGPVLVEVRCGGQSGRCGAPLATLHRYPPPSRRDEVYLLVAIIRGQRWETAIDLRTDRGHTEASLICPRHQWVADGDERRSNVVQSLSHLTVRTWLDEYRARGRKTVVTYTPWDIDTGS